MIRAFFCNSLLFLLGGFGYGITELLWRRYTHWSMVLTGGFCFTVIYRIFKLLNNISLMKKCLIGSLVITVTEFFVGCRVNIQKNMNIWDYSNHPLNYHGQICPFYTVMWALLSIPVAFLCRFLCRRFDL